METDLEFSRKGEPAIAEPQPRKPLTPQERRKLDERLDEQGEESFPASDPPAQPNVTGPHIPERPGPGRKPEA